MLPGADVACLMLKCFFLSCVAMMAVAASVGGYFIFLNAHLAAFILYSLISIFLIVLCHVKCAKLCGITWLEDDE